MSNEFHSSFHMLYTAFNKLLLIIAFVSVNEFLFVTTGTFFTENAVEVGNHGLAPKLFAGKDSQ